MVQDLGRLGDAHRGERRPRQAASRRARTLHQRPWRRGRKGCAGGASLLRPAAQPDTPCGMMPVLTPPPAPRLTLFYTQPHHHAQYEIPFQTTTPPRMRAANK